MNFRILIIACLLLPPDSSGAIDPWNEQFVAGFESPASISGIVKYGDVRNIRQVQGAQGITQGASALAADFNLSSLWPSIVLEAGTMNAGGGPWGWSAFNSLSFDLTNPSDDEITYNVRLDHDEVPDHWDQRQSKIAPRTTQTIRFYLKPDPFSFIGIRRETGALFPGVLANGWNPAVIPRFVDPSHVKRVVIFTEQEGGSSQFEKIRTLIFDRFRATNEFSLNSATVHIVDRFGQLSGHDWPGKIHQEEDLIQDGVQDLASLGATATEAVAYANRFRGWEDTPFKLEATGKFRVQKIDGGWWFVTPDGKLFYSSGVTGTSLWGPTVVGPTNDPAANLGWLTERAKIFEALPETNPFFNPFFFVYRLLSGEMGRVFQFYGANVAKKYPSEIPFSEACRPGWNALMPPQYCPFALDWMKVTLHRQSMLGFTSFGAWTNPSLTRSQDLKQLGIRTRFAFPATPDLHWHNPHKLGRKNHDPFAPGFPDYVSNRLKTEIESIGCDDEWCMGYFVDNELEWGLSEVYKNQAATYYIPIQALMLDGAITKNAKTEFVQDLMATYPDFKAFAVAWTPHLLKYFSNWDEFRAGNAAPALAGITQMSNSMKRDFSTFLRKAARVYYSTVKNALSSIGPDRLYLCSRFAESPREVLEEAARYCDVMSVNVYYNTLEPSDWHFGKVFNEIMRDFNKPGIIGEFHFGALDRGHLIAAVSPALRSGSQVERARRYKAYEESVLKNPGFIGAHWFEWKDQPVTGRLDDYESFNIGFTTIGDRLYPEMVEASKEFHSGLYERRMAYLKASSGTDPVHFRLSQNYPNPFSGSTRVDYDVAKAGNIKITVFDVLGRQVAVPVNEFRTPGKYSVPFNLLGFASGTYFYRMEGPDGFEKSLKMVLVK